MPPAPTLTTLKTPEMVVFDWHGTLVNTHSAMSTAIEETLPLLEDEGLISHLLAEEQCALEDDAKLVRYIRIFHRLHPKILSEQRISRTEIFDAIFGDDSNAKKRAHQLYNRCYRNHFGDVIPFQQGIPQYLSTLRKLGITVGIATNRSREFLNHELRVIDNGDWLALIDATICADDVDEYKPNPEMLLSLCKSTAKEAGTNIWYIADSYLDIVTARNAGMTAIYYNGAGADDQALQALFNGNNKVFPDAIVNSFDEVIDLLEEIDSQRPGSFKACVADVRPPAYPPPEPPPVWNAPDWHPAVARLTAPAVVLFDWHATLVDTLDAMYHAVDEMLPELKERGLLERMVEPSASKTEEDAKLVEYIRTYCTLHPRIRADRKISRTDIFEVMFGADQETKQTAHRIFTEYYRKHFGVVNPFEPRVRDVLLGLRGLGLRLGVITNRDREFFEYELAAVDETGWQGLFEVQICGDDTLRRKPHPDQLNLAVKKLGDQPSPKIWYVGDSSTDIVAAKRAGMTAVFFNGAQWDQIWLEKIFPGDRQHPHKPDVIVNDFSEFWAMVLNCLNRNRTKLP